MTYLDPNDPRRAESSRKYYQKNKTLYAKRATTNKRRAQIFVAESKSGKPCMDCGVSYPPYVMDYDHRDPDDKIDNLSAMALRGWSNARLAVEIAKCDLVCSNCHRERTHQRRFAEARAAGFEPTPSVLETDVLGR